MGLDNYYRGRKDIGNCITPGLKVWANGIPLKGDTYKSCTNMCKYCFARGLTAGMMERAGVRYDPRIARTMNISHVANMLAAAQKEINSWTYWALRERYFIELGTMCEIFQEEDLEMRVTWNLLQLFRAYRIPLFINTKANLLIENDDYFRLIAEYPAPIIMSITLIGLDDEKIKALEPRAPLASERLELISRLAEVGVPTVVYCGPFMLGITDQDIEGYTEALIKAGAVGVHVRNFYITGKLLHRARWRQYLDRYQDHIIRDGHVNKFDAATVGKAYRSMQEVAERLDPRFRVVGMKSNWFDLNPLHGKLAMDWLPDPFKEAVMDFTAIPIFRAIRERHMEPQLLVWDKLGYKRKKVRHPYSVAMRGGPNGEGAYLALGCYSTPAAQATPIGSSFYRDGWDYIKQMLWGTVGNPPGFVGQVKRIYPVVDENNNIMARGGGRLYAYIPEEHRLEYVRVDGAVEYVAARDFHVPQREGGTKDKFWDTAEQVYALGGRWDN